MNQAPPPPTPEQLAAQLDEQIAQTQGTISTLQGEITDHEQSADEARAAAEAASLRRSEVAAQTAALGVNAVVTASQALANVKAGRHATAATRYRVDHPEGERQELERQDMTAQGRRKIWTESFGPAHTSRIGQGRMDHLQYEERRARALGMHELERPWGRVDRFFSRLGRMAQGGRFRAVDPYQAQMEHDHNGVVSATDAMALTAQRVADEARHSIYGRPALPDFVQARRAAGARTNLEQFVVDQYGDPSPALLAESGTTLSQNLTISERVQLARDRLANQDADLARVGQVLHQLAFGARTPAERRALEIERDGNPNDPQSQGLTRRIALLRDPDMTARDINRDVSDNELALDDGVDFRTYADSLRVANRNTLALVAQRRNRQAQIEADLANPHLDPATETRLRSEARQIQRDLERLNGVELTRLEDQIRHDAPRRTQDLADIDADLTTERGRLQQAERDVQLARRALAQARANGGSTTTEENNLATAKRDRQAIQDAITQLDRDRVQVNEPLRIRDRIYARRSQIVEADNRLDQINVSLAGGVTDPRERQTILDEFTRVALRQIDVMGLRSVYDAYQPGAGDVLGQQAQQLDRQYELAMRLRYPPQGRRSDAELRAFLGDDRYNAIIEDAEAAAAQTRNGTREAREQALIAKGIQDALDQRIIELQQQRDQATKSIYKRAVSQDELLESERVQLPLLIGAVATNPTLMREDVVAQEETLARQRARATHHDTEAATRRTDLARNRRRLAQLQADRARYPS